jgi:hypothetical protein
MKELGLDGSSLNSMVAGVTRCLQVPSGAPIAHRPTARNGATVAPTLPVCTGRGQTGAAARCPL